MPLNSFDVLLLKDQSANALNDPWESNFLLEQQMPWEFQ